MPRTGTTSIQTFFTQNQIENLNFPKIYKNEENTGHFHLGDAVLYHTNDVLNLVEKVFDNSTNDLILFSSERLIGEAAQHPLVFKNFFSELKRMNYEVHVLCFLREVDEFCWSMYLQCIRDEQFVLPFSYFNYYEAVLDKTIIDFEVLYGFTDLVKLSCLMYSPHGLESTIEKYLFDIYPSFTGKIILSKHSSTPSILLHSFFLHLFYNGIGMTNGLRWKLIGADLDGNGFLRTEMPFDLIDNNLLYCLKISAIEKLTKADRRSICTLQNIITSDARNLALYDISALNKNVITIDALSQYMKYLMKNAICEGVNAIEVMFIYNKVCEFAKGTLNRLLKYSQPVHAPHPSNVKSIPIY